MDDEEILRGRRRGENGWHNGAVVKHPNDEHQQRVRRILEDGQRLFQESTPQAIRTLITVMEDGDAPHSARIRAAELILDRVYGKAPLNMRIIGDTPFERLMMGLVLQFAGGAEAQVIEMEQDDGGIIWEDEDE
jgi:hypothetical protein